MARIRLNQVSLDYPLYGAYDFSIKRRMLDRLVGDADGTRTIRAIDNISIEASSGARIGLFGPNGSGKSTLLRLVAGVYPATSGRIEIEGEVMPLLGLSAGANLDFIADDNISLLLRISGRRPTPEIIDEIWAFTELDERMRRIPLRMFSSGMLMRVLFATATAFPADILLLDEWLSVVDEQFAAKAEQRLLKLVSAAAIVVLASHDQGLLHRICNAIVRLERGRVVATVPVTSSSTARAHLQEICA
ncbi:sugar ABC transporter ATP-binding protein [Bradyrhizobium sp. SSBR45G]|uniref:ABC transporter ATP-binding protein n=1 Tax=unclassified Bradyrhizobium TaxID=2631580 RepID=UPI002342B9FE|nr:MULTISPECIES: ABC transporter ATP-binding protein [unclassified Bradyrhizobium]GLH78350.1 sugar ABC transporter ATP-binding protein [Bradyrhizobium sp. SSBR45G]GLH86133.1 sugar ABC transporter ATP-binding protein [Bradyrhizobium sp. SSBR45R]